jgi:hypothetical protein
MSNFRISSSHRIRRTYPAPGPGHLRSDPDQHDRSSSQHSSLCSIGQSESHKQSAASARRQSCAVGQNVRSFPWEFLALRSDDLDRISTGHAPAFAARGSRSRHALHHLSVSRIGIGIPNGRDARSRPTRGGRLELEAKATVQTIRAGRALRAWLQVDVEGRPTSWRSSCVPSGNRCVWR